MSPENITALVGVIVTFAYILKQQFETQNKAKLQAIVVRARQDKIENNSLEALLENDKKQRARIDQFAQSFQDETVRQDKTIEKLSKDLQTALLDKAEQKGQLKELIRNQGIDRDKLDALSKRISELEIERAVKNDLIIKLTDERETLRKQLSDSSDMVSAKTLQISDLEAKLLAHNGTQALQSAEISGLLSNHGETTISNVQTAKIADNSIDDKKDNE